MIASRHLGRLAILVGLAACSSTRSSQPDASDPAGTAACVEVGTALCHGLYTCLTPMQIAGYQLPATEAECVTFENADCGEAMPSPGYCKGRPQISAQAAGACADALGALSCAQVQEPAPDACFSQMCAP